MSSEAFFRRLAKEFHYKVSNRARHHVVLQHDSSPISICCDLSSKGTAFIYLYVRTSSWAFEGERTDLHDALSILVSAFLRFLPTGVSCRMWDVTNPAVPVPETEVYARYVTFDQPHHSLFQLDTEGCKKVSGILRAIRTFEVLLSTMLDWMENDGEETQLNYYDWQAPEIRRWARKVARALKQHSESKYAQYNLRRNPCWFYYRSIKPAISVFHNPPLVSGLRGLLDENGAWKTLHGNKGELFVSPTARNFVAFALQRRALRILRALPNESNRGDFRLIPLENYCVLVGVRHVLFIKGDCGYERFEQERESLRNRHKQEATFLFPVSSIIWKPSVEDAAFEDLILELLNREPGVRWVRKIGHTNEPDGGRDLIAEWDTPPVPDQALEEGHSPVVTRRIIVQCKVSKYSVGKAKVRDIHDTLKRYNASGYCLVVSSCVTRDLAEHLEKLRYETGCWSNWWTRIEIEERLKRNQDLITKYPKVVTVEQHPSRPRKGEK